MVTFVLFSKAFSNAVSRRSSRCAPGWTTLENACEFAILLRKLLACGNGTHGGRFAQVLTVVQPTSILRRISRFCSYILVSGPIRHSFRRYQGGSSVRPCDVRRVSAEPQGKSERPRTTSALAPRADGGEDQSGFSLYLIRCGKSLNFLQMLRAVGSTA